MAPAVRENEPVSYALRVRVDTAVEARALGVTKPLPMPLLAPDALTRALFLNDVPAVVAFTGSGGKTTCSEALADEAAAAGLRAIVTTTTKIRVPSHHLEPRTVDDVRHALATRSAPLFVGCAAADGRKLCAPPLSLLEEIIAARPAERIIIEADGSRGASIKGYQPYEPVLPSHVDRRVVMVGADAVGARRGSPLVHRDALLWPLLRLDDNARLTVDDVARALIEQPAYLEGAHRCATSILINKTDDDVALATAQHLAMALAPHVASAGVVEILARGQAAGADVIRLWRREPRRAVDAVVLAAGSARRFGALKQVVPLDGVPMIVATLQRLLAAPLRQVTVVLGHAHAEVEAAARAAVSDRRVRYVVNPDHRSGLASSVRTGVAATPGGDGVLLALADMPFLAVSTITRLLDTFADAPHDIVAPVRHGRRGHPVVFAARFAEALQTLEGDRGGAAILERHAADLQGVEVDDDGILRDVDHPAALTTGGC